MRSVDSAVVLVDPKTPYNVGSSIRACVIFGTPTLRWTGSRIDRAMAAKVSRSAGTSARKLRMPREERMKEYGLHCDWQSANGNPYVITDLCREHDLTPVAVEVMDSAEMLPDFVHPERPLYVFGPEDGSLGRGTLEICHRFLRVPSRNRTPLNLAATVNIVLYDRFVKMT
jgi:tRNA(Leu) C34 or U34 (ribose-2'-O)-methylase TrmL